MPTYSFRCPDCGPFDLVRPMSQARAADTCPRCGASARRNYGAPALRAMEPGVRRAFDAAAQSADAPAVVGSVPGRSRSAFPRSSDPRHARLPRP